MSRLIANGVTTVESKSGAGLDRETELRPMRVSRAARPRPAGHGGLDLPRRPRARARVSPAGATTTSTSCATRCCPRRCARAWSTRSTASATRSASTTRRWTGCSTRPRRTACGVKLHADQYTDFGAGAVVARHRGLSADHLEYASQATVRAMAEAGTVATLLAGAHFTLHETQKPPVETVPRARRADGARDQFQPGELAHRLAGGADASRLLPVPADARGGVEAASP